MDTASGFQSQVSEELIAHQANGSPFAPPTEQVGTWEDPNTVMVIYCWISTNTLDFFDSYSNIRLVVNPPLQP